MKVTLDIAIDPTPWKAPRLGGKFVYSPHNEVKRKIKHYIRQQYNALPYSGYTSIFFHFAFAAPLSASKTQRARMLNREIFPTKMDCTNMQKLFEDCLQGIVISNDNNVISVTSYKCYEETAHVTIIVQDHFEYMKEHEEGIAHAAKERQESESHFSEHFDRGPCRKAPETGSSNCLE
jgi:Holliday junction resolvase RusA-like endonuclease